MRYSIEERINLLDREYLSKMDKRVLLTSYAQLAMTSVFGMLQRLVKARA